LQRLISGIRIEAEHLCSSLHQLNEQFRRMPASAMASAPTPDASVMERHQRLQDLFGQIQRVLSSDLDGLDYLARDLDYVERLWQYVCRQWPFSSSPPSSNMERSLDYMQHIVHEAHLITLTIKGAAIDAKEIPVEEYKQLRAEIQMRIELQHQILNYCLIAFAGVLGIAFGQQKNPTIIASVLLIYPMLALCLALGWVHNSRHISEIGKYVERLETRVQYYGWERFLHHQKDTGTFTLMRNSHFVYSFIFLGTQVITITLAIISLRADAAIKSLLMLPSLPKNTLSALDIILLLFDTVSLYITIYILLYDQYRTFYSKIIRMRTEIILFRYRFRARQRAS
jgi:hypothetical protein